MLEVQPQHSLDPAASMQGVRPKKRISLNGLLGIG